MKDNDNARTRSRHRHHGPRLAVFASLLILTASCDGRTAAPIPRQQRQASLDGEGVVVVPLVDGGAYANDATGAVWYLREQTGTRVKGLPKGLDVSDIMPTIDGGAYMTTGSGVWYLRESTAVKVREGAPEPSGAGAALSLKEKWLWASLQVERQRRQQEVAAQNDVNYGRDDESRDDGKPPGPPR